MKNILILGLTSQLFHLARKLIDKIWDSVHGIQRKGALLCCNPQFFFVARDFIVPWLFVQSVLASQYVLPIDTNFALLRGR